MQKGFAHLVLIAVFVLAILAAGGTYLFIFKDQASDKLVPPVPPINSETETEIFYWETYTDLTYNYSINYPNGWYLLAPGNDGKGSIKIQNYSEDVVSAEEKSSLSLSEDKISITIGVYKDPISTNQTLLEWLKSTDNYTSAMVGNPLSEQEVLISGKPALKLTYQTGSSYVFSNGVNVFYSYFNPDNSKLASIFDQIISSIKFLDNKTTNWKTYENKDLQYSIKYPSEVFVQHKCPKGELLLQKRVEEKRDIISDEISCTGDSRFTIEIITPMGEVDEPSTDEYYQVKQEKVLIDGIEGTKYLIYDKTDNERWVGTEVFIKKNRLHRIWLKDEEFLPLFNQMLSTLRFLE